MVGGPGGGRRRTRLGPVADGCRHGAARSGRGGVVRRRGRAPHRRPAVPLALAGHAGAAERAPHRRGRDPPERCGRRRGAGAPRRCGGGRRRDGGVPARTSHPASGGGRRGDPRRAHRVRCGHGDTVAVAGRHRRRRGRPDRGADHRAPRRSGRRMALRRSDRGAHGVGLPGPRGARRGRRTGAGVRASRSSSCSGSRWPACCAPSSFPARPRAGARWPSRGMHCS